MKIAAPVEREVSLVVWVRRSANGEETEGGERPPPPFRNRFHARRKSLPALQAAAAGCHGCELYKRGTQTVFGEGRRDARVMMVGEQPGVLATVHPSAILRAPCFPDATAARPANEVYFLHPWRH
jgi:hypothetical protein